MAEYVKPPILVLLEKIDLLFIWTRFFYPRVKGIKNFYLFFYFFPQKILRINGSAWWPMHFTSRILYTKRVKLGYNSFPGLSQGGYIQARNGIEIGHNLRMGPNVGLVSSNHDIDDYDQWLKTDPIIIGDNVWIGMNSVVMPGITIGDNVVIGANSVVNKDIPANSIAVGNPCKVIKEKSAYKGKDYSTL